MNIVHASEYVDDHSLQHITRCSYIKFCCVSTCLYVASTFPHRYEWAFEQDEINLSYRGHIRKGREIFVTFEFAPDKSFHKLKI